LDLEVIAFALLAMLSLRYPVGSVAIGRLQAATILLLAGLLLYVALQTLPFAAGDFVNVAWKSVNELVGPVQGTISVSPGMTFDAIPTLAMPFLVFFCALALFQSDAEALRLWRALAYFGAAYAVLGILQELFFPEQLLLAQKKFYLGSLTATFVNRNTAGTFFGVAFLLNLALLFNSLRKIHIGSFINKTMALDIGWRDKNALVLLHVLFCLITAVALFLTQSRGAVGASFIGAVVGVILIAMRPLTADRPTQQFGRWRRYAIIFAGVLVVTGLFALFAGRSVYRMEAQGAEDARWCSFASTIEAITDHPFLGTGFGAFQDVFPAYRNADCAGIFGVWDRAHNFFLEGYLGLGLPFAVALVAGYAILIGVFVRGLRDRHRFRFIPVMGLTVLILASLHSLVDFSLQIPGFATYFAAIMASTATISLGRNKENHPWT
jgi:O-antigen ligase